MTIVQDPVKNAIWRFLNHYAYGDALFLAERLFAEVHSDEALFLLATTYYRLGKPKIVEILFQKHGLHQPQSKLLYAQACWDLENYAKAEQALLGCSIKSQSVSNALSTFQSEFGESACFAAALLGRIYLRTERPEWAEKCFTKSLQLNPFLWTSFEKLCQAGCKPNPSELFNTESLNTYLQSKTPHTATLNVPSASHTSQANQVRKKKANSTKVLAPSQVGSNVDTSTGNVLLHFQDQQMQSNYTPQNVSSINDEENMGGFDRRNTPSSEGNFLRSTPSDPFNWDSSMDSYTGAHPDKFTKTQMRISHSLLGGTNALSPLSPSIGVMPLYETPSPTWERAVANNNTTPSDMAPPTHDLKPPVKKMVTRQSKKIEDSTAAGKLFLSSENSRRDSGLLHISSVDTSLQSTVVNTRRSTRFSNSSNSVKENAKKIAKGKSQPKDVTNKKITRLRSKPANSDLPVRNLAEEISKVDCSGEKSKGQINITSSLIINPQKETAEHLIKLFQSMGYSLIRLCQYDCKKAVQSLEQLPPNQRNSCWALSQLAKCYFELTDYKRASKVFQELRRNHPYHVTGLAYYSTTLWHLQDGVALSALAHDLVKIDSLSPETWCAVGNCFSLRRDYDSSVKFFARAVQLAPHYAYGHTLLGHEYAYSDDHERAMACFRKAIHCDSRHYNAWYGIGSIYYKQENFALAEIHFRKALTINQHSSVLLCHLGIVQHAQKRSAAALSTLGNALILEPLNPLCKFHRASILFATERHKDALKELLELKQIVPKESLVYFLIGKTYKVLGENHLAMMNFSWAHDLDPKGTNNHIKEAIDKLQGSDDIGGFSRRDESSQDLMDSTASSQDEDETAELERMQDSDESL